MRHKRSAGFTLIEAVVMIAIVALLAAAVEPNIVAFTESQQERSFENQLASLANEAREKAIARAQPVDLEFNSSSNSFTLDSTDATGSSQQLASLTVPSDLQPERFQVGAQDSDATSWKLFFYPDGSSDGGGVQMERQNYTLSLVVNASSGLASVVQDQLPDPSTLSWPAGDYIHRASS